MIKVHLTPYTSHTPFQRWSSLAVHIILRFTFLLYRLLSFLIMWNKVFVVLAKISTLWWLQLGCLINILSHRKCAIMTIEVPGPGKLQHSIVRTAQFL